MPSATSAMSNSHTVDSTQLESQTNSYSLQFRLQGHKGVVLCMSITDDGKLASGGFDGVRVWDLRQAITGHTINNKRGIPQFSRPSGAGDRGATTALSWIRREDEPEDGLVFGTAGGLVVCWKEVPSGNGNMLTYEETYCAQLAHPSEITAICFDASSNQLVVSNRNSVVQLFRIGSKLDLHPIFSVIIKDHIPKAIAFGQRSEDRAIHTFGLHDGQIHTLSGKDGKVIYTRKTGCKIGNVASNLRRGVFCIDDPNEGAALFRFDSWERIRVYSVPCKKASKRPRQITFIEDCKYILSGSDHGGIYIFDRRSGTKIDCLVDESQKSVQALTATEHVERPFIFAAMSSGASDDSSVINIWRKNIETRKPMSTTPAVQSRPPATHPCDTFRNVLQTVFFMCILVMAVAFLYQNRAYVPGNRM